MQSKHTSPGADAPASRATLKLKPRAQQEDFWINWKVGGWRPKKRHRSAETARVEAERLAQLYPGVRINTFQCTLIDSQCAPKRRGTRRVADASAERSPE